jgi:hypothetical protein
VSIYLTRTASLRFSTNKRLVIPIKKADNTSLNDALLNNAQEDARALTS